MKKGSTAEQRHGRAKRASKPRPDRRNSLCAANVPKATLYSMFCGDYPVNALVTLAPISGPADIKVGERYHVRYTRSHTGSVVEGVMTLIDHNGERWFKLLDRDTPWMPLTDRVEILGRVRYATILQ